MDPLLAHLGWHSPLVDGPRKLGVGHLQVNPSFLPLTGGDYAGVGIKLIRRETAERT